MPMDLYGTLWHHNRDGLRSPLTSSFLAKGRLLTARISQMFGSPSRTRTYDHWFTADVRSNGAHGGSESHAENQPIKTVQVGERLSR
jgi:hypothetical protein